MNRPTPAIASLALAAFAALSGTVAAAETVNLPVFGTCAVIDSIDCTRDGHRFVDHPSGASRVENILGRPCRVLDVQQGRSGLLSWRLGEGKGVRPNGAYVVAIEFPDDMPRSFFVRNCGNNSRRSFYTGAATGDSYEGPIVAHNPESLKIPQSGRYQLWTALTFPGKLAHTRDDSGKTDIATEGFDIALAQYRKEWNPASAGLAVSRIMLCEIADEKALWPKVNLPPEPLPRRHIFWREEMADGGVTGEDGICPGNKGLDWFEQKFRTMKMLGQNTYCKDLLEFGHNQGWDVDWKARNNLPGAKPAGRWMWGAKGQDWDIWGRIVPMAVDKYGLDILPYYEYGGAAGDPKFALGPQKRAEPLTPENKDKSRGAANYTHIWWSEGKLRVDITDPDTLDELKYILDCTIFRFKDQVARGGFAGAMMRPRPGQWAVSFSDATRARFSSEANGGRKVSREDLRSDKALYGKYLDWWGRRRAAFMDEIRKYLESNGVKNAMAILDNDATEPGQGLADARGMVTDDPDGWRARLPGKDFTDIGDSRVVSDHLYLKRLKSPASTWGQWEWQHANPAGDPQHYTRLKNVWLAMPFHALFTVTDPECLAAYRNGNGTDTLIRHYDLNEGTIEDKLVGYTMADWERAGRACMLSEITAMANGDPVNIGYLMGSNYTRGFPGPVQEFNLNFLALPALPSKVLAGAADAPDVTVREIDAGAAGRYFAIVHTGSQMRKGVGIRLPGAKVAMLPATGKSLALKNGVATFDLKPWQLIAVRAK